MAYFLLNFFLVFIRQAIIVMNEHTIKLKGERLAAFEETVPVNKKNGHIGELSQYTFDPSVKGRSYIARYIHLIRSWLKEFVPPIVNQTADSRAEPLKIGDSPLTNMQTTLAELLARNNKLTIENQQLRDALAEKELQIKTLKTKVKGSLPCIRP